jgi:predicted aldo/keto reductase-like oxidoreductase
MDMKKLGFGCMRLPMIGGAEGVVDQAEFNRMIDLYLDAGFCYFDTAHVYLGGQSETALREGLVKRYPRDRFFLVDKLSGSQFQTEAEILPFFQKQLDATGVDFFDLYLMHSLTADGYEKFTRCRAFETVAQLKAQGKVRHMGISFHDKPAVLEQILTDHPEIEAVQIQLNYLDYDNPSIESGAVYEVCRRFHKPVLVMEPVKGGNLVNLPPEAQQVFDDLGGGSAASYAIRYAASFEGVEMVLSGMSDTAQMADNLSYMRDFQPLTQQEQDAVAKVRAILKQQDTVPCTACRYCVDGCPRHILIPDLFACLNTKRRYHDWNSDYYYEISTTGHGTPADCVNCRQCTRACPQHLDIPALLKEVAEAFAEQA